MTARRRRRRRRPVSVGSGIGLVGRSTGCAALEADEKETWWLRGGAGSSTRELRYGRARFPFADTVEWRSEGSQQNEHRIRVDKVVRVSAGLMRELRSRNALHRKDQRLAREGRREARRVK